MKTTPTAARAAREAQAPKEHRPKGCAAFPRERGASLSGHFRQHRGLAFDPLREAWPGEDPVDIGECTRVALWADFRLGMAEVGEWSGHGDVGEREAIPDKKAAVARHYLLQIVEDRRQFVELCLLRRLQIAGTAHETRRDDPIEEDLRPTAEE